MFKIYKSDIGKEFRKVVEENVMLERDIHELFLYIASRGEKKYILQSSNELVRAIFSILLDNKDLVAQIKIGGKSKENPNESEVQADSDK